MPFVMRSILSLVLLCVVGAAIPSSAAEASRPNVLFIAIDDLNDWVGCLGGHPQVKTPNIDALARRGTLFSNAHCQAPLCNPSRSSLLTGLRPSTTGIYGLVPGIREVDRTKNQVTLPQTFTAAGYFTSTSGKIYHDGSVRPRDQSAEFNIWTKSSGKGLPPVPFAKLPTPRHPAMDWGPWPENDEDTPDHKIASGAIEAIQTAPKDKPFFIAAGFRLPHVPCYAPQKWFDLYPEDTLQMPPVLEDDREDTPRFSWYLHWRLPEPRLSTLRKNGEWRSLVRAYMASTSFMDSQVGRLLDALHASGRADNTMVVLWSDHGWHLGEKNITGKNTLWERSTRVPLIFAGPGVTAGAKCTRPVELLDIFPTLLEMAAFPPRSDLEGHSLLPLLKNADAPRAWPAITTHNHDNHSVRTERWRYIRYADHSEELYDLQADANEWRNLAFDPQTTAIRNELAGWLPPVSQKPAPGSAQRVLTYDPATGEINWEGKNIGRNEPIPD